MCMHKFVTVYQDRRVNHQTCICTSKRRCTRPPPCTYLPLDQHEFCKDHTHTHMRECTWKYGLKASPTAPATLATADMANSRNACQCPIYWFDWYCSCSYGARRGQSTSAKDLEEDSDNMHACVWVKSIKRGGRAYVGVCLEKRQQVRHQWFDVRQKLF
jgi:hypothetical protein